MAFDGTMIAALTHELNETLTGGRITKVAQPENDELMLTIKNYNNYRLFISADASLPLICLTDENKENPMTAPNFCMLLRKHFNSARILSVTQPGLERVIDIKIEHLSEMGDLCVKHLYVEIMGKHSNIILCDDNEVIVDSIKHIPASVSSVREVLPGRPYFIPKTTDKLDPLDASEDEVVEALTGVNAPVSKAVYTHFTGISPLLSNEVCHKAGIDPDIPCTEFSKDVLRHVARTFLSLLDKVKMHDFAPIMYIKDDVPAEFSAFTLSLFDNDTTYESRTYDSVSKLLTDYFFEKNRHTKIKQKSLNLRKLLSTLIEREAKKKDLQLAQLKDTEKRDKFKHYGDLLMVYGYQYQENQKAVTVEDYETGESVTINLDDSMTPIENAKRYYDKYAKAKRTFEAVTVQLAETKSTLEYLESVQLSLELAEKESDLNQIRDELSDAGFMKKSYTRDKFGKKASGKNGSGKSGNKSGSKGKSDALQPIKFTTPTGCQIYVGRNNAQNDELTFSFAKNDDWWFHAKGIPGSHVILRAADNHTEPSDHDIELAAGVAAFYSGSRDNDKVEVDYVKKKEVKKPGGSKPGFVVYYTNYSMMAIPDIKELTKG